MHNCQTVGQLVKVVQQSDPSLSLQDIIRSIESLNHDNKLLLNEPRVIEPFGKYLKSNFAALSFWLTIIAASLAMITVFLPTISVASNIIRIGAGIAITLFIPGYALTILLFPREKISAIHRMGIAIGLSLTIIPFIGLILNYSPLNVVTNGHIVIVMAALSASLMLLSTYKDYLRRK